MIAKDKIMGKTLYIFAENDLEEIRAYSAKTEKFYLLNIIQDTKVNTHAINRFVVKNYPVNSEGEEKEKLSENIYEFPIRTLKKGGEKNEKFISL